MEDVCLRFGLTTATTPSGFIIDFKSFQNSTENRCSGNPPPEKQSWMTISNVARFSSSSDCMAVRLLYTQLRASSKKTWLSPGYARPKYSLAASYTAGSISTIVVEIPCRMNASAEMPAPSPLEIVVANKHANGTKGRSNHSHDEGVFSFTDVALYIMIYEPRCLLQNECVVEGITEWCSSLVCTQGHSIEGNGMRSNPNAPQE